MTLTSAFISHSSADKPFARQLNTSLTAEGIPTFLDERDIRVGDSIPARIYAAIEIATHLIYVISKSSIQSRWVEEELGAAKMREKRDAGFKILPVLIEDVDLPMAVAHIRYADFRNWQRPEDYKTGFLSLLHVFGVQPHLTTAAELHWYAGHRQEIAEILDTLVHVYAELGGALDAEQSNPQHGRWPHGLHYTTAKHAFTEYEIDERLRALAKIIPAGVRDGRLHLLREATASLLKFSKAEYCERGHWESYTLTSKFRLLLGQVRTVLKSIEDEIHLAVYAAVETRQRSLPNQG